MIAVSLIRTAVKAALNLLHAVESNESRGYFNLGCAIRIGQILQLESNELKAGPTRSSNKSDQELPVEVVEERRRTFWCAFLLERLVVRVSLLSSWLTVKQCDGIHRTTAIRFDPFNITIPMPAPESNWLSQQSVPTARFHEDDTADLPTYLRTGQPSPPADLYGFTLRIADLWAQVVTYVAIGGKLTLRLPPWNPQSNFFRLDTALADWQRSIPPFLLWDQQNIDNHEHSGQLELYGLMHCLYFGTSPLFHRRKADME
jgi:hypothetical protein